VSVDPHGPQGVPCVPYSRFNFAHSRAVVDRRLAPRFKHAGAAFVLLIALPLAGCSAVREISDAAQRVQAGAQGIREDLQAAQETGEVGPQAQTHLNAAGIKAGEISRAAGAVIRAVPGVHDNTPLWYPILKWGLIVAGVLGGLALCVYLNVGAVARPVFSLIGGLIPSGTKAAAKFDAEAVVAGALTPEYDKSITARRVSSPAFDAAFIKAKADLQAKAGAV
jgi:hypothetical protein